MKDIDRFVSALEEIHDDLMELYDSKSEWWQDSERGEAVMSAADDIACAIESLNAC